jgi:hypothetical protein
MIFAAAECGDDRETSASRNMPGGAGGGVGIEVRRTCSANRAHGLKRGRFEGVDLF